MSNISLRKQAQLAPKYALQLEGLNLYLSENQQLIGCNLTENINEAMQYSVGFDNEATKKSIWSATVSRMINTKVNFNVIYL